MGSLDDSHLMRVEGVTVLVYMYSGLFLSKLRSPKERVSLDDGHFIRVEGVTVSVYSGLFLSKLWLVVHDLGLDSSSEKKYEQCHE